MGPCGSGLSVKYTTSSATPPQGHTTQLTQTSKLQLLYAIPTESKHVRMMCRSDRAAIHEADHEGQAKCNSKHHCKAYAHMCLARMGCSS